MSDSRNTDENKKDENSRDHQIDSPMNSSSTARKERRALRFLVPSADASKESFVSALSYGLGSLEDDYEDFTESQSHSFLRKYVLVPLHHSQPRTASRTHSCRKTEEYPSFTLSDSSSRQLFEILKHSPTPSDADMNLLNATYQRKLEAVKEAILEGADINTFRDRQTPLLIAVEVGDGRLVDYLLSVPNVNPDFRNHFGQTPLFVAVKNACDRIVRMLLEHNADVNIPDNMGRTPLIAAVFQKRLRLTKLLLAFGADCDKADLFGETPLDASAIKTPDIECLLTLLKVGASPETVNMVGLPLISRTIVNFSDFRIIEALVQYGASVNHADLLTKKTPLHFAALTDNLRVAKFLVAQGADVNLKSTYGFTPFEEALFHNNASVADFLTVKTERDNKEPVRWPHKGRTDLLNS